MEVRKLRLEYIPYSTSSILGRVTHSIFRDKYQEDSANLPHVHGLVALHKEDMDNEQFRKFVSGLKKGCFALEILNPKNLYMITLALERGSR